MMVTTCEKCGKTDTYVQAWKGRYLCFECTLAARHPRAFVIEGQAGGMAIKQYREANSEAEALLSFREDFPNAQNIDINKI